MKIFQNVSREAWLTFIGTAMVKFATGIIGIWGTINLYFISYLKNHGSEVSNRTNSMLMLFIVVPTAFLVLLATRFAACLGYKLIIRVCAFLFTFVPFLLNIELNFVTLGAFFLFVPMTCFAISSIPIINCLWSMFPKDLNKVSGFAILFFSLGMIVWNLVFLQIVNPDNQPAVIDEQKQAYFTQEISDRVVVAVNWIFGIAGIFYIWGSFLISKREEKKAAEEYHEQDFAGAEVEAVGSKEEDKKYEQVQNLVVGLAPAETVSRKSLISALKDKKFLLLFAIAYMIPLYLVYLVLFMKIIFMPIINDDRYLAMCSIVLIISGMIGGPFWGLVADRKGFKKTLLLVCVADLITKLLGLQCGEKWNIIIMYFMIGFNDRGIITIIGPGLIEIFGLEMATELIPYKGFSLFLAYLTVPLFQMVLNHFMDYKGILVFLVGFTVVALGLAYHFEKNVQYVPFQKQKQVEKQLQQAQAEVRSSGAGQAEGGSAQKKLSDEKLDG